MHICDMDTPNFEKSFDALLSSELELRSSDYQARKDRLHRLEKALLNSEDELVEALLSDFGKPAFESKYSELYLSLAEIRHARKNLKAWMKPRRVRGSLSLFGSRAWILPESKGVSLVISPWNFPIMLALGPLASAIAAGCPVAIKPSEFTPACSAYLAKLINSCFPPEEVLVFQGDAEVSKALLKLPFKHIFFTGSTAVGKMVMKAAAEHLSSVTLELGGKSPVLIFGPVDLKDAARRIVFGKWINAGQTCIAPDTVYIQEDLHDEFVKCCSIESEKLMGVLAQSDEYSSIVNDRHWKRLKEMIAEADEKEVLYAAADDPSKRRMGLKLIEANGESSQLMSEEIFGPVLAVKKSRSLEETIAQINSKPTPLSLYIFSKSKRIQQNVLNEVAAGSVGINDVLGQFYHPELPFGGLHSSGMGKAHGKFGFEAFSHPKSVIKRSWFINWMELAYPPYSDFKKKIANIVVRHL